MTFGLIMPLLVLVVANTAYQLVCAKTPAEAPAFLSLAVTYVIATVVAGIAYFCTRQNGNTLTTDFHTLNWTSYILGACVVGLEAGYLLLYRAGWDVSIGSTVAYICMGLVMVLVGTLFLKEGISIQRIVGVAACVIGLYCINQ